MTQFDQKMLSRLSTKGIPSSEFEQLLDEPLELSLELMSAQGIEFIQKEDRFFFATVVSAINDTEFCIVDIETNGSKPQRDQIIEIGAVKVKNHTIIDTYESLVQCDSISKHISEITGISVVDTFHAPELKRVMEEFRLFLGSAVFVAHDVKFDYSFISTVMQRISLEPLLNRSLCTIDMAERTIESRRYGLAYLNEQLELYKEATHHRALSDAITTVKLFKRSLQYIPNTIESAEELIRFSKESEKVRRPDILVVKDKKKGGG